ASGVPSVVQEIIGGSLDAGRLLGQRLAQLHIALTSAADDPLFSPEPYSTFDQRSSYQSMRNLFGIVLRALHTTAATLEGPLARDVEAVLSRRPALYERLEPLLH